MKCLALVLAVLLMSTVANDAANAAPKKVDACTFISTAEMETIIGKLRGPAKSDTDIRGYNTCDFTNSDGSWVKILIYGSDQWGLQKGTVSEMHPTAVAGLGEEAYFVKRGTTIELYAKKGSQMLEVDSTVSGGVEVNKKVAAKIVPKLK